MSIWLNNKIIVKEDVEKPCKKLGHCPYGQLVEEFKLRRPRDEKFSCSVFGHDCPIFYHFEDLKEE